MATRFYFSSSQTAAQSLGFASWAQVNSVTKMALLTEKDAGEVLGLGLQQATTVGSLRLDRQFVSPALTGTSFINSALSVQLACREFANGDNTVTAMAARVVTASGTLRGTLLAATKWFAPTSEIINNATLRNMAFASGTIVASVTGLPDDRIVIEIGFGDNAGTTPEFQARYGAPSAISDHGANMTETTSLVGWAEFASTLNLTIPATVQLQQLSEALDMEDFRMSGLNKIPTEMQNVSDAFRFGRFMLLSDFQRPIADTASGLIHRCLANVFVSAIRNRPVTDTIDVDISDIARKLLVKIIGEQVDITDAVSTLVSGLVLILRELSDTLDVADGFRKLQSMGQQEAQETVEAFTKLLKKVVPESVDIADSFSTLLIRALGLSDSVTLSDAMTKALRKILVDSEETADLFTKLLSKIAGDTTDARDASASALSKVLGDRQDSTDSFSKVLKKVLTDQQAIADTVASYLLRFVGLTDNVAMSDLFTKLLAKSIADSQATADGFSKLLVKMSGDSVDIVDITLAFRLAIRAFADNLDLLDTFTKRLIKQVGDLGSVADDRTSGLFKSIGDRQDVTDAATLTTFAGILLLAIMDSVGITEDQRKKLFKNVGDLSGVLDTPMSLLSKSLADRQDVTDAISVNAIVGLIILAIADSLGLSDDQRKALFKNVGDLAGALDNAASLLAKSLADRQDVSDTAPMSRIATRAMLDSLDVSDRFAKSLLKTLTDNVDALDGFTKALLKVVGDNEDARDALAQSLSKIIGDSQTASDLLALALSKTISEQQAVSDTAALIRFLRRLMSDDLSLLDTASATRITTQLILEVLEAQDVSDVFVKKLIKVLGENASVTDAMTLAVALASPLLREFITNMVAGNVDPFGQMFSGKAGLKMAAGEDDPLDIEHGAKGRRQK